MRYTLLLIFVLTGGVAQATELTREQTMELVAQKVADIQKAATPAMSLEYMDSASRSDIASKISDVMKKLDALRTLLATNPYIRVSGFTVGVPAGVTIDFIFPTK